MRLTFGLAVFFAAVILVCAAPGSTQKTSTPQTAPSATSSDSPGLLPLSDLDKSMALRTSSSAMLTQYPNSSNDVLSSATVDQQTKNQAYMRNAGKGGVADIQEPQKTNGSAATPNGDTSCQDDVKDINNINSNIHVSSCDTTGDFLTEGGDNGSYSGVFFSIPSQLTTENPVIKYLVGAMQLAAGLFVMPIIVSIGLSYITGGGVWRFSDALEAMPRLVLALIGVASCLLLAEQIIIIGNAFVVGFMHALNAAAVDSNLKLPPVKTIVMPSNQWETYMNALAALSALIFIAQVIAPAAVFGNTWGTIGATIIVVGVEGAVIGLAPKFILTGLAMAVGAQVIIRIILIDLYVILSPIAMIAAGLPGQTGVKFARDWIMGFLSLVASHFGVVVALGIGLVIYGEYDSIQGHIGIVSLLIKYSTLALMLRVPSLFRTNATDLVRQVGPIVSSFVQSEKTGNGVVG